MKRKILVFFVTIITAVCLCLSFSACDYLASNGGDSSSSTQSGNTPSGSSDADGSEESGSYTPRTGNSSYGYYQLANETNGEDMQSLYYQFYAACEDFVTDTSDVKLTGDYYLIDTISYKDTSLTLNEALSVWRVFYLENPMYYWLSTTCVYSEKASAIYMCIDADYANYSDRAAYDEDIALMIEEVGALVTEDSTELETAMIIHDYIIDKIDYAYLSDGVSAETAVWAHNLVGVSTKGGGVCEAYSKTFLTLCLINGLDCVISAGTAEGEGHGWNLVEIDGAWYGVDCTWDDTGTDTLCYSFFGMNTEMIDSTRTTDDTSEYGTTYLYDLPEVSQSAIQLVTLFKGEEELGEYINLDAAFAAMTDSTADYTIELYFYSSTGVLAYTQPSETLYIYSEATPSVNSITINGIYTAISANSFYVSSLSMQNKLTLYCNLTISNFSFYATELDLGEYTLTTSGDFCLLDGTIYDDKTTDVISINSATTNGTRICGTINVSYVYGADIFEVDGGTVNIARYIVSSTATTTYIYVLQSGSLHIDSIEYENGSGSDEFIYIGFDGLEEYPTIYLGGVNTYVDLLIFGTINNAYATPETLSCTIATLGNADDFSNLKIYFYQYSGSSHGYVYSNKTTSYTVNESNEIVYSS